MWQLAAILLCLRWEASAIDISVTSAGFKDGSMASFAVDGTELNVVTGRGVNVVVLEPTGSMRSSRTFDTFLFANESDFLKTFIDGLGQGDLVAFAVQSDASAKLTADGIAAIESCGGTLINTLAFHDSYALIGVKGGQALAESLKVKETGAAQISAQHTASTGSTGSGSTGSQSTIQVTVNSAGFKDGSSASFIVDGTELNVVTGRGVNVVVLEPTGAVRSSRTFDTFLFANESDFLKTFIDGLGQGDLVAFAVQSDASAKLTADGIAAIESCGGTLINTLAFHDSYALIGVKGGQALAESLKVKETGAAQISAQHTASTGSTGSGSTGSQSTIQVTVNSAGFKDGSSASFIVDGTELNVVTGRGVNVVVLEPTGSMRSFRTFDTFLFANESDFLKTFIDGLGQGDLVAFAVQSDASAKLTADGIAAIESCGGTLINTLAFHDSYALIGVKGGQALAESLKVKETGAAQISAQHTASANSPIATTSMATLEGTSAATTTPDPTTPTGCGDYLCPSGSILKVVLSTEMDAESCCVISKEQVDLRVISAGWEDGNVANFYLDGNLIFKAPGRGMAVVTLLPSLQVTDTQVFDTVTDEGSSELVEYLQSVQDGTWILFGAKSEASSKLSDEAKAAIKSCGGEQIDSISFRGAYALVGRKGGQALSETVLPRLAGPAKAIGNMEIQVNSQKKPICDARVAVPPMDGYFAQGNLELDAGCRYALWEQGGANSCVAGSWTVFIGSSNTILFWMNFAKFLSPDSIHPIRDSVSLGMFHMADLILENGQVVYKNVVKITGCAATRTDTAACQQAKKDVLAAAPAYSSSATRVTLFDERFWPNAATDLQMVNTDAGWDSAPMALVMHVITHYIYCLVMHMKSCPRDELREMMDHQEGLTTYLAEQDAAMTVMRQVCAASRFDKHGCMLATASWFGWRSGPENDYVEAIRNVARAESTNIRLLDLAKLGATMVSENVAGHGTAMNFLWGIQMLLGSMCPVNLAAEGHVAEFQGELCTANQVNNDPNHEKCPAYRDAACGPDATHHWCQDWECANSIPCLLVPTGKTLLKANLTGACMDNVSVAFPEMEASALCHRIWCADDVTALALTLSVFLPSLILLLWVMRCPQKLRLWTKSEKPAEAKEPEESVPPLVARQPTEPKPDEDASVPLDGFADVTAPDVAAPAVPKAVSAPMNRELSGRSQSEDPETTRAMTAKVFQRSERETAKSSTVDPEMDVKLTVQSEKGAVTSAPDAVQPAPENIPKSKNDGKAGDHFPLGLARFLAALHVVIFHLFAEGVTAGVYLYAWGFTWVPWFFMLSGFVLGNGHLCRPNKDSILGYVERRLVAVYPLYATTLLPAFAINKALGVPLDSVILAAQTFLLQAWNPEWTEGALGGHCWFLSAMVLHFILFKPLTWLLDKLELRGVLVSMASLFLLPWLVVIIPEALQQRMWFAEHAWGSKETLMDLVVVFVKFHPLCYVHVFALGMLLAKLRKQLDHKMTQAISGSEPSYFWRAAVQIPLPLGILGLLLVFNVREVQPWGYQITTLLAVLLPFQALVLSGLAGLPSLPLPYLAHAASYFDFLEPYAFAVYLFQGIAYSIWPMSGFLGDYSLIFLLFLFGLSVLAVHLVQKPAQMLWGSYPKTRRAFPVLLAALLVALNQIPGPSFAPSDLPAVVRHEGMVDLNLGLSQGDEAVYINPSLLLRDGQLVIAARRHHLESLQRLGQYEGKMVVVLEHVWHSSIVFGTVNLTAPLSSLQSGQLPWTGHLELSGWTGLHSEGGPWTPCVKETWIPENETLIRKILTGPEDPKLTDHGNGLAIAFNSFPPMGRYGCSAEEVVSQMYMATGFQSSSTDLVAKRLPFGPRNFDEKNWIPFKYQGRLHYVYSPIPHKILLVNDDESVQEVYETSYEPLRHLQGERLDLKIRGSAQAVLVNGSARSTPNLPQPHYLALLHIARPATGEYNHFAYRFSAEPPFAILQVSKALPLQTTSPKRGGKAFAFVSGLLVQDDNVLISYGAGDLESRVLALSMSRLDEMFLCSNVFHSPDGSTEP